MINTNNNVLALICASHLAMTVQTSGQALEEVGSYGANMGTVAIDGSTGVLNEGTLVRAISFSPFNPPVFRDAIDLGSVPGCLQVVGKYAYSAEETGKFHIINLSNLDALQISGSVDWEDWKESLWVRRAEDYAYVAGCTGIRIIDIHDKANPTALGTLPTNDCVYSLTGDGGYLYVAHSSDNALVSIYSLVNPAVPALVSKGPLVSADAFHMHNALAAFGDTAYTSQYGNLAVIDISDRSRPVLKGNIPTMTGQTPLDTSNGILHASTWDTARFYRLSSPLAPEEMFDVIGNSGHEVTQTAAIGNLSYSARTHGLWITDVLDKSSSLARSVTPHFGTALALAKKGDTLFVGTGPGISALDVSDPGEPVLLDQIASRWTGKLVVSGNKLYNISAWGYIEIYDIENTTAMAKMSEEYELTGNFFGNSRISASGGIIAATADRSLSLYSIEADGSLSQKSITHLNEPGNAVAVNGSTVYTTGLNGTLSVYDASNASHPQLLNSVQVFSDPSNNASNTACTIVGNKLHALFGRNGYALFDISHSNNPVMVGKFAASDLDASGISASENCAYLAAWGWNGQKGLRVLDISNPSSIFEAVGADATNYVSDVIFENGLVYYAEERGGLRIRKSLSSSGIQDWKLFND